MRSRKELALDALGKALRLRKQLGVPLTDSISAIDAAEKLGIEVRFVALPSMEGIYVAGANPKILVSSLRPQGRRMFTCAHELGHHVYGHGDQIDEIRASNCSNPERNEREFVADCFAAYFLMPKVAIENGMTLRGMTYQTLKPLEVYALASWLGVGYQTLVTHLRFGLGTISASQANELAKTHPKKIRALVLGLMGSSQVHMVDHSWTGRAIDCEVDDYVVVPEDSVLEASRLKKLARSILQAVSPGIDRIADDQKNWSAFVRVSPREFVGRSCFRFEERCE
jgi:hypothetical protein